MSMKALARTGVLLAVVAALASPPAAARGKGGRHGPRYGRMDQGQGNINRGWQNCLGDFARYCPGQIPKNGSMARCLGPYRTQVAPICAPVLARWCAAGACG